MNSIVMRLCCLVCLTASVSIAYDFDIQWYNDMPVDHFSYGDNRTFNMRYIINSSYWSVGKPIFFYCGNEGDILLFVNNTGFVWDIAPEFNAMVVFAEHRYYGQTMPFGNESYTTVQNRGYLSTEQALADFAVFLRWLKEVKYNSPNSPVIAFGGSYGGMLAAWFRMKYPNIVVGSLASSAPIWQFNGITPCWRYSEIVTRTFANSGSGCDQVIKKSWDSLRTIANRPQGVDDLNKMFRLCENSKLTKPEDVSSLIQWLTDGWGYLAMIDYPYPTNFLEPVPGWPVQVACGKMTNPNGTADQIAQQVFDGISVYQNSSGQTPCFSVTSEATGALDADSGWEYQTCTEMVMPMCNNGTDMFDPSPWDFPAWSDYCFQTYQVRPRLDWATTVYGGTNIGAASNIIFSNGDLDPWNGGGVVRIPKRTVDDSLFIINVKASGHHYDLRAKHPKDTVYVRDAREKETKIISKWLRQHKF